MNDEIARNTDVAKTKDITNLRSTLEWLKTQGDVMETDK